jgi:hypothetical protein
MPGAVARAGIELGRAALGGLLNWDGLPELPANTNGHLPSAVILPSPDGMREASQGVVALHQRKPRILPLSPFLK